MGLPGPRNPDFWMPTAGSATLAAIQSRAVWALVIVSMVVKLFEATITNVVAGSSVARQSVASAPSTFEMKCSRGPSR